MMGWPRVADLSCGFCHSENVTIDDSPHRVHGDKLICNECGRFRWLPMEKNRPALEKRPKCPTPAQLGVSVCEYCHMPEAELHRREALEVHHRDGDPANNERENLAVYCTPCHKLCHHMRTYRTEHRRRGGQPDA